jgi:hypothetical protein
MTDTAIHLRDAARPLGLGVNPDPENWSPVLDFLVSKRAADGFIRSRRLAGPRLDVTDRKWSWGQGETIRETSEEVALAVAGRDVVLPELDGPVSPYSARDIRRWQVAARRC